MQRAPTSVICSNRFKAWLPQQISIALWVTEGSQTKFLRVYLPLFLGIILERTKNNEDLFILQTRYGWNHMVPSFQELGDSHSLKAEGPSYPMLFGGLKSSNEERALDQRLAGCSPGCRQRGQREMSFIWEVSPGCVRWKKEPGRARLGWSREQLISQVLGWTLKSF